MADQRYLYSIGVFVTLGLRFSVMHQRLITLNAKLRRLALQETDAAVKESAREFRLLTDSQAAAHIGSWDLIPATGRITWSAEAFRLCGLSPATDAAPTYEQRPTLLHPDDRAAVTAWFDACLAGKHPAPIEYRPLLSAGEERWMLRSGMLEAAPDGTPLRLLGTLQDITDRKQAEAQMPASQAQFDAALASMTDAVFISDADGRFIHFNDAFATFHRFRSKEECAKTFAEYPEILEVFMADGTPAPVAQWAVPRALRGETVANAEYGLRRKDTGETWVGSYSFAPIRDPAGLIVGSVVTGRDITERKRMDEELARHRDHLQELVAERTQALAQQESLLRTVMKLLPVGVWGADSALGRRAARAGGGARGGPGRAAPRVQPDRHGAADRAGH